MEVVENLRLLIQDLENSEVATCCVLTLHKFLTDNERTFEFNSKFTEDEYSELIDLTMSLLEMEEFNLDLKLKVLKLLRLLSRDKPLVLRIKDLNRCINCYAKCINRAFLSALNRDCAIEVLKCLSNWIFHSKAIRDCLLNKTTTQSFVTVLGKSKDVLDDFLQYQLRIIFLMSAHEHEFRVSMIEFDALKSLDSILQTVLSGLEKENETGIINNTNCQVLCEVLKAAFNITLVLSECSSKKAVNSCSGMVKTCCQIIKFESKAEYRLSEDVITPIAHFMVNLPKECLEHLCPLVGSDSKELIMDHQRFYQHFDMEVVIIFLENLRKRVKITNYNEMKEAAMAILTCFCYVCREVSMIRKYLRQEVLPPLKLSKTRPEEREDVCGDVVRLMTTIDVMLKNMAADFLYVLCKENRERLIRYTGYGNSAGFLASRGLMIPGVQHSDGNYSEDELTDVEDDEHLDVTLGATRESQENPLDKMTEEEKEEEAMKLMSMIERLKELNTIKPMTINKDGKLQEMGGMKNKDDDE